ncbi:DUF413 domain-containing protein [Saccharophagus degradans]|uniref:DUF413 domain-containing protein n=1 Tax=Saccharophagus degradans TaxID=86304 RepID=UPI002477E3CA|nr:DUF413 domain-containing protein [Saccharophagus degradans]WGO96659.1 DUF413 domain-containing protein [Saccharophagus degradans]
MKIEFLTIGIVCFILTCVLIFLVRTPEDKGDEGDNTKAENLPRTRGISKEKSRHKSLIGSPFQMDENIKNNLSQENIITLEKYGAWMQALDDGDLSPITDEQVNFLSVCKGIRTPANSIEVAWYNYKKVVSREGGGDFGYHSISTKSRCSSIVKCNACGRNIDFCICGS